MVGFGQGTIGGATVSIVIRAVDKFSSVFKNAEVSSKALGSVLTAAGAALTGIGIGGAVAIKNLSTEAAKFESIMFAVNKKVKDGEKLMDRLEEATSRTIPKFELMKSASTALQLGLTEEALPAMAEFASKVGPAMGETATFMFDSIVRGVGRASPLILDNLGLVIDVQKEYEKWAEANNTTAAQIDKATKLQIIQNKVMEEAKTRGLELDGILSGTTSKQLQLNKAWEDAKLALGQELIPLITPLIENLTTLVEKFKDLEQPQKTAIARFLFFGTGIILIVGVIALLAGALILIGGTMGLVAAAIVAAVGLIIFIFFKWKEIVTGLYLGLLGFGMGLVLLWEKLKDYFEIATATIGNFFKSMWNEIVEAAQSSISWLIDKVNRVIKIMNRVPGVNIPIIPEIDLSAAKVELTDVNTLINQQQRERQDLYKEFNSILDNELKKMETKLNLNQKIIEQEEEITEQADTQVNKQQELVDKLKEYRVIYRRDSKTGEKTFYDIYNPKAFSTGEFQSKEFYEDAKLGGGVTINIENINGLDPEEISKALSKELGEKMTI